MLPLGNGQIDPRSLASQPYNPGRFIYNHAWLMRKASATSVSINFGFFTRNSTIWIPTIGGVALGVNHNSNILTVPIAAIVYVYAKFTYTQVAPSVTYPTGTVAITSVELEASTTAPPAPTSTVTNLIIAELDTTGPTFYHSYNYASFYATAVVNFGSFCQIV